MWVCPVCSEGGRVERACSGSGDHKQLGSCLGGALAARIFAKRGPCGGGEPSPGVVMNFESGTGRKCVAGPVFLR